MKLVTTNFYKPLFAIVCLLIASCSSVRNTEQDLIADAREAQSTVSASSTNASQLFNNSAGYAIFPNVGKGAYIIGGASGNGVVYQNGNIIGYADLKQVDIGLQAGGKAFIEVLFFQTQEALDEFKNGGYQLSANASAVVLERGVSRDINFENGVAVVTMPKAGAMAGVSVGGQRFDFRPANIGL